MSNVQKEKRLSLVGRVAIVTGGNRGIGSGISLALAKAGASVVICYRRDEAAAKDITAKIEGMGKKAIALQADITDCDKVKEIAAKTVDTFGKVDILVNNAGIASRGKNILDTEAKEFHKLMEVHFFGALHFTQAVLPHMRKQGRGDIHFISSLETIACLPGHGPYVMAKAALEGMAKVLAKEELQNNIRVNIIAPGLVETEMGRRLVKANVGRDIKELYPTMPFRRACQPSDIGNLCAFLCSEDGGYISGHVIYVDGGGTIGQMLV
ncbi:MAG: glucose 1-dehydrogenase [Chloroflexi bacterium]|nr:glucose 1-dehydrogenase [Chloroflexota bacterium]